MKIQRLTIVNDDRLVVVDGYGLSMDTGQPENVHAVQWLAGAGEVEFNDGTENQPFTDLEPYLPILLEHARLRAELEAPPPPPTDEQIAETKRIWRNHEIGLVAERLDQYKNDSAFGVDTFPFEVSGDKKAAAIQLNDYRVALIEWPDSEGFPHIDPPEPPEFWTAAELYL
ncbi:hypothetical protein [Endozoicomonas sp. ONNA1]|uniref:hypothetical protein n=1 Tax=Endozoicomonas sp. ONNA1 TaxID=2828740 RepID=UPI0021486221|nr:hypothetical protein [Endozoicomonas sp. ONNA1]